MLMKIIFLGCFEFLLYIKPYIVLRIENFISVKISSAKLSG